MSTSGNSVTVEKDIVVAIDYQLTLDDGEEIDRSAEGEPLEYVHGHSQLIRGLEAALHGMAIGDEKQVTVAPIDAYGERDEEQVQALPLAAFPEGVQLTEGEVLSLRDGQSGQVFQTQVLEVRDDEVLLDFNHPLAGETLHFAVRIASLRQATPAELAALRG